jgi:hypothetical protein
MLSKVKLAMRLTTTAYDSEITRLINAACADLGVVDITATATTEDALLTQAIITYCRLHFGTPEDYDRLKASYDEQKAQLMTAKGYGFPA